MNGLTDQLITLKRRIRFRKRDRLLTGRFQDMELGQRIDHLQLIQSVLMPPEILPWAADFKVLLRDPETIRGPDNRLDPLFPVLGPGVTQKDADRVPGTPADTPPELMEL